MPRRYRRPTVYLGCLLLHSNMLYASPVRQDAGGATNQKEPLTGLMIGSPNFTQTGSNGRGKRLKPQSYGGNLGN